VSCVATPQDGWTPIFSAARNGHTEVVSLLLQRGANKALPNNAGKTPLDVAKGQAMRAVLATG
jgi:ankyrin repeat protein